MGAENGVWIMHGVEEDDPCCIHTYKELIKYVDQVGFLPLFKNEVPGFSVEENTVPEYWWCGDPECDPWMWREIIARSKKTAYGKFFDKKAGFISKEWFPYFANFRRDGYDFDALWDDEKAGRRLKKIMDLFADNGKEKYSFEIKKEAGFGKGGEKNFEGTITDLQMKTYLCVRDFRQKRNKLGEAYGWDVALYCPPEHIWGREHVTCAYDEDPKKTAEKIYEHMRGMYPDAGEKQIRKVMGL